MDRQNSFNLILRKGTPSKTAATSLVTPAVPVLPLAKIDYQMFEAQTEPTKTTLKAQTTSCPLLTFRNGRVTVKTITQLQTQTKLELHGKGPWIQLPGPTEETNESVFLPKIYATRPMTAAASVIPPGKTYHQIFEAQSQLSKSLLEARTTRHPMLTSWNGTVPRQSIPQLQTQAKPNLRGTGHWAQVPGPSEETTDVLSLPEIVVAQKSTSDICERITKKMESKHTQAMEELESLLTALSSKYEQLIQETGERFLREISQYDGNMDKMMQKLDDVSEMERLTYQEIHDLWNCVNEEFEKKKKLTNELDETLNQFVSKRTPMISEVLKKCKKALEEIGYMMPSDIQKLLENKAMMINVEILASQRAVANLIHNLKEKDLQKGLFLRFRWENKLQDWTYSKVKALVDRFRQFMSSPHVDQPREVQATLESMWMEQRHLGESCKTVLQAFSASIPPECSKAVVTQWYSSLSSVNEQIGKFDHDYDDCVLYLRSRLYQSPFCRITNVIIQQYGLFELHCSLLFLAVLP
ncbi:coiled-coil domain-containing protein 180-like [Arapaima gigas]